MTIEDGAIQVLLQADLATFKRGDQHVMTVVELYFVESE